MRISSKDGLSGLGPLRLLTILATLSSSLISNCAAQASATAPTLLTTYGSNVTRSLGRFDTLGLDEDPRCPPCNPFNCNLAAFPCINNGKCNDFNGKCICPPGFGGEDCSQPLCDSLADGDERYPRQGDKCECKEGWTGINCNVCDTNQACSALVPQEGEMSRLGSGLKDDASNGAVCYREGFAVKEMYQMCDVTNRKILDMLPDRPPQVTFSCSMDRATCAFEFWIGQVESFYCSLSNCTSEHSVTVDANTTEYSCQQVSCACIPGKMLCGENGSVDITDFLAEEITGPGKFTAKTGEDSRFEEPAMNQLINDIFGDTYITIKCQSGECLRASEVPGFARPLEPNDKKWVIISAAVVLGVVLACCVVFWLYGRGKDTGDLLWSGGKIRLNGSNGGSHPAQEHIPAALQFSNLSYRLPNGSVVLDNITGFVKPGEIMAVLGASGAGKSTFLDLLARRSKKGSVSGSIMVNGRKASDQEYRRVVGFVDQEDTLMGTLTVYETILNSALLRLPRDMSFEDKNMRVLETMHELGILGIKDSRIGESGHRSISGGEKRRVSIACELVTSPSILFLDEPTSGLDSYNAINVVECLVHLAKVYKRTVIFTIHQPRSNIVALFDKLVLLAKGKLLYSGPAEDCHAYFADLGLPCPTGYNIADFLIDMTMQEKKTDPNTEAESALIELEGEQDATPITDDPEAALRPGTGSSSSSRGERASDRSYTLESLSKTTSRLFGGSGSQAKPVHLSPRLGRLVRAFASSSTAQTNKEEIAQAQSSATATGNGHADMRLRAFKRASWLRQFRILSGRAFKNLYRDPLLMLAHYAVALLVAAICGFLFRNVTFVLLELPIFCSRTYIEGRRNDIPGFQNRMGLLFFVLAIFGFGCLTTLNSFGSERLLFMRERANGYYSPATWFAAKLLFDVIPLRVFPPFILGAIVYQPVGLVPAIDSFWRFILVLVLFNLTASSAVLLLSVLIKNTAVANLVGSLVMLFNLLFAGLLINRDKLPPYLQWLETISFFHAAFEALLVNEVRYLQLTEDRWGVSISVPAATILSMFGFRAQAFWFPDVTLLVGLFGLFTMLAFLALVLFVRERR